VNKFRYARDRLCGVACAFYAVNRWALPLSLKGAFLRNHFNDLLFIPAALPLMLWLQRKLGLRHTDAYPDWSEVLLHLVVWSVAAEVIGPRLFAHATGDGWDVAAYAAGALVSAMIWRFSAVGLAAPKYEAARSA
jgi:hypothetical protein